MDQRRIAASKRDPSQKVVIIPARLAGRFWQMRVGPVEVLNLVSGILGVQLARLGEEFGLGLLNVPGPDLRSQGRQLHVQPGGHLIGAGDSSLVHRYVEVHLDEFSPVPSATLVPLGHTFGKDQVRSGAVIDVLSARSLQRDTSGGQSRIILWQERYHGNSDSDADALQNF